MTVSADFSAEPGECHRHCGKPVGIRAIIAHAGTVSHSLPVISVPRSAGDGFNRLSGRIYLPSKGRGDKTL